MKLLLQVSAVLSAIVLSFCAAPASAFNYNLPTTPTKWELGPNNASKGPFGTPGSATWSIMGPGLSDDFFGPVDPFHGLGLTTYFTDLIKDDQLDHEINMIIKALDVWDSVSGFTSLGKVSDGNADFGAAGGQLGDIRIGAIAFDGPVRTDTTGNPLGTLLGHGHQPGTEAVFGQGGTIYGDIHLDNSEHWIDDEAATGTSNGIDLFTVLLHEFGHALGLEHSLDTRSVMYANYTGAHRTLSADDIAGITYLYGPQPLSSGAQIASVPEPGTLTLLGLGLAGLAAGVRRRAKATKGEQG